KIKRDVRITMIYEGTSEIQQNIIYLYRWRTTIKSKGEFYQKMVQEMRIIGEQSNLESAKIVAHALELLNDLIMFAHNQKLTRQQHIQFLLSDVITWSEVAAALVRKTAERLRDSTPDAIQLRSVLRIFIAEMARLISNWGMEIIMGSDIVSDETKEEWIEKVRNLNVARAESNIITEMDKILF
ncbi:MAG TPA: acyl-CoA dehydrogenase, partial [Candidatus Marinimicrobia bacterium]|nr:acyl-CoA dehydrogenase [Candidatus Neomarinimicrobiota bacterium]